MAGERSVSLMKPFNVALVENIADGLLVVIEGVRPLADAGAGTGEDRERHRDLGDVKMEPTGRTRLAPDR